MKLDLLNPTTSTSQALTVQNLLLRVINLLRWLLLFFKPIVTKDQRLRSLTSTVNKPKRKGHDLLSYFGKESDCRLRSFKVSFGWHEIRIIGLRSFLVT